jgi:hypothetical protein
MVSTPYHFSRSGHTKSSNLVKPVYYTLGMPDSRLGEKISLKYRPANEISTFKPRLAEGQELS